MADYESAIVVYRPIRPEGLKPQYIVYTVLKSRNDYSVVKSNTITPPTRYERLTADEVEP